MSRNESDFSIELNFSSWGVKGEEWILGGKGVGWVENLPFAMVTTSLMSSRLRNKYVENLFKGLSHNLLEVYRFNDI